MFGVGRDAWYGMDDDLPLAEVDVGAGTLAAASKEGWVPAAAEWLGPGGFMTDEHVCRPIPYER